MALENFMYSDHEEVISVEHRFDEVIKAVMIDPEDSSYEDVVAALLKAYWAAVDVDQEERKVDVMSAKEAENYMSDLFYKHTPHEPADCVWMWPAALPYRNVEIYPKKMMAIIIKCMVDRDKAFRREMQRHFKNETAEQEASSDTTQSVTSQS